MGRLFIIRRGWGLALLALSLTGCASVSTGQQTLVAHEEIMQTREYSLQATSTSSMEELLLTLDNAEIMATRTSGRQLNLIATLDALGVPLDLPPTDIPTQTRPVTATLDITRSPDAATPTPEIAISNTPEPTATATNVVVTPFAPTIPPTRPPATESLTSNPLQDVVFATGVGADDCATSTQSVFTAQTAEIYVIARAYNIRAGSTIRADWSCDGALLTQFEYTPDFSINGACIWFYADQSDFAFTPGIYQVTLYVNGEQAAEPATFTVN